MTPEILRMDGCRVTSQSDVPEEVFLFTLYGTPCFPRGDLTTVTGPAKSGKTFLVSMLMACCVERRVLAFERVREEPLRVLWLDTEQSRMTTKRILTERVMRLAGGCPDEQFYVLNARGLTPKERVEMLRLAIETYRPDLVVIDGIADLMDDINSGSDSTALMQQLLGMAAAYDCNVTAIIHLNRSGERLNLRGWIGTVMVQKSYEVLNCEKVFKTQTFSAVLTFSRRYHQELTLYYEIDKEGLPFAAEKPDTQPRDAQGKFVSKAEAAYQSSDEKEGSFNQAYIVRHPESNGWEWDLKRLFSDAMGMRTVVSRDDLIQVELRLHVNVCRLITLFHGRIQAAQVQTAMDRSGRVVVIVPCLPPLSFNPLPPLHRGAGYKAGGTVWNHNSL